MSDYLELTKAHTAHTAKDIGEWVDDRIPAAEAEGWDLQSVTINCDVETLGGWSRNRIPTSTTYTAELKFSKGVEQ